jgi:hypothetical protein
MRVMGGSAMSGGSLCFLNFSVNRDDDGAGSSHSSLARKHDRRADVNCCPKKNTPDKAPQSRKIHGRNPFHGAWSLHSLARATALN